MEKHFPLHSRGSEPKQVVLALVPAFAQGSVCVQLVTSMTVFPFELYLNLAE